MTEKFVRNILKTRVNTALSAENIDSFCFRTLRKIHDRCNFTCGLLFAGTERLAANPARMQGVTTQ